MYATFTEFIITIYALTKMLGCMPCCYKAVCVVHLQLRCSSTSCCGFITGVQVAL